MRQRHCHIAVEPLNKIRDEIGGDLVLVLSELIQLHS